MEVLKLVASGVLIFYPLQKSGTTPFSRNLVTFTLLATFAWTVASQLSENFRFQLIGFICVFFPLVGINMIFPMSCVVLCGAAVPALPLAAVSGLFAAFAGAVGALAVLMSKALLLNWQIFGPPAVGGFLAGQATGSVAVWIAAVALGAALQVIKLKYLLDQRLKEEKDVAERHYRFFGNCETDKTQREVLEACGCEQEQIDRVLFGAGLY